MNEPRSELVSVVSVIVLNFNGKHLLDTCLTSLLQQSYPRLEVVLVDNGSQDGSVPYVRERYPTVRVIENGRNLGAAAANNVGIRASTGDFLFVLNNDTEVEAECVANLVRIAESNPSVGMCATLIRDFTTRNVIDGAGLAIYPDCSARGRGRLEIDRGQYSSVEEVFGPSCAAGLYRRAMLDQIGLFDDEYFIYCDDTDLAFRGRLAGWKCLFVPDAVVYHIYSATCGKYSPFKAFLVERNRLWTAVKVLPWPVLVSSLWFTAVRYIYQGTGALTGAGASGQFAAERSRFELAKVLLRAHRSAIAGLPSMLSKRRQVQSTRRATGTEVRCWFRRFAITARDLAFRG